MNNTFIPRHWRMCTLYKLLFVVVVVVVAFKHTILPLLVYNHPQRRMKSPLPYQHFCSTWWNFSLRDCNFLLNPLLSNSTKLLQANLFSVLLHYCMHHSTPVVAHFKIQNLVSKTANECTSPLLQATACPDSPCQPVNAMHFANVVCLAPLIMWPGNHSSQPWLFSLLALKHIQMTFPPQPGLKSSPTQAEN